MIRFIPSFVLVTLAMPAFAHPGHHDGGVHWLSGDHLAMLGALALVGGAFLWRVRAHLKIRKDDDTPRDEP